MMNNETFINLERSSNVKSKSKLLRLLVEPHDIITNKSERRQAFMISAILLSFSVAIINGIIYMGFFSPDPVIGLIIAIEDLGFIISYIVSRTKYYKRAPLIFLSVMILMSIFNIGFSTNHSSEQLLILTIWSAIGILVCGVITSFRNTLIYIIINLLILLLLPVFISTVLLQNLFVSIIFNAVVSVFTLAVIDHRDKLEKDRLSELSILNEQLQSELVERKRVEKMITYSATHDALTNLPNRVLFMDRLQHLIDYNKRHRDRKFAVLFLDLDNFKIVNDTLGHEAGDQLLIESALRMKTHLRSDDTVARLGGDEFVIILEDIEDVSLATQVAERIEIDLSNPFNLKGHKLYIFVSIGIVFVNTDNYYENAEDILTNADIAMYISKEKGLGSYEIFNPVMLDHVKNRHERVQDLNEALQNNELTVYYQPIKDMKTDSITGFEALLRWQHPEHGLIHPAEFISIAEDTGLIVPIGYWVLDKACSQISIWQQQFPSDPPMTVSVNLSSRQCSQPDLFDRIVEIINKNNINPASLKLELTESLVVREPESTFIMLSKLRKMGVEVQIDDFGTGYSSLGSLHSLPIDTLKIDRMFINRLGNNDKNSEIVRTILALAHNLKMKVVAEGVETETQLEELVSMGCEFVQGFFFAQPVNTTETTQLLEKLFNDTKA